MPCVKLKLGIVTWKSPLTSAAAGALGLRLLQGEVGQRKRGWNEAAAAKGCSGFIPIQAPLEYFHTFITPLMFLSAFLSLELQLDSQFIFTLGAVMFKCELF